MTLGRERLIVLAGLAGLAVLAWLSLLNWPDGMTADAMADMPMQGGDASPALIVAMWAVMMVAMMLPAAAPMLLIFASVQRRQGNHPVAATATFAAGYLLVWGAFAVAAGLLQTALEQAALLSPALILVSTRLAAATFLLAAAYEVSPLKDRCLAQCISPVGFIMSHWRPGLAGALRMGMQHGAFCLGCCWALMLLLFAVGVMNLLCVAALAGLVLLQKLLPWGRVTARCTGAAMALIGVALLFRY